MAEFIIAHKFGLVISGVLAFLLFLLWFSNHMLRKLREESNGKPLSYSRFSTLEKEKVRPYLKFYNQEFVLDRKSGKFFHLDYVTPVAELSEIIVQTSLYHHCFISFSGKIRVKIDFFYYSDETDQVIAVCRADLSLLLNSDEKAGNQYFLSDENVNICFQMSKNSEGTMNYFNSDYARFVGENKFMLDIMLRSSEYGGVTNIYLKRNPDEYFNNRYY
ncbi:MAG: hypothetical protein ACK5N8_03130 [Alphaproteobacteria bacterium]